MAQQTDLRMCTDGKPHHPVVTYSRPWRRRFRKTMHVRCWFCDVDVVEP